ETRAGHPAVPGAPSEPAEAHQTVPVLGPAGTRDRRAALVARRLPPEDRPPGPRRLQRRLADGEAARQETVSPLSPADGPAPWSAVAFSEDGDRQLSQRSLKVALGNVCGVLIGLDAVDRLAGAG